MGRILLIRHGESTWNAEGRWQGWADPPLSDTGRDQARAAAVLLADEGIEAVVASDLRRARETAHIIATALAIDEVGTEPGIRERDVGHWSGLTRAEIEARWPGQIDAWRAGRLATIPGGEGDIHERVVAGVGRILDRAGEQSVLAVTHGGVIRSLVRHLGGPVEAVANLGGWWLDRETDGPLRLGPAVVFGSPTPPPTTVL